MIYILVHNDCQYCSNSTTLLGVYDKLHDSMVNGWKHVIINALKPWVVRFYKNPENCDKSCGLGGMYYIEEWDIATNVRIRTYMMGEAQERRIHKHVLDEYLKQNVDKYETILQAWYDSLCSNVLPWDLQQFVFETAKK